ncbi:hypothetical protein BH11PSE4_BH11PSE4_37710 [soil metagenome]
MMRAGMLRGGLLTGAVLAAALLSRAANAYTPEQEQMCTPDAMRLCSSEIPNVDRVTACMVRLRAQLSPGCRQFFRDAEPELTPVTARRPLTITPRTTKAKKKKGQH